jgi:hypothetical protein
MYNDMVLHTTNLQRRIASSSPSSSSSSSSSSDSSPSPPRRRVGKKTSKSTGRLDGTQLPEPNKATIPPDPSSAADPATLEVPVGVSSALASLDTSGPSSVLPSQQEREELAATMAEIATFVPPDAAVDPPSPVIEPEAFQWDIVDEASPDPPTPHREESLVRRPRSNRVHRRQGYSVSTILIPAASSSFNYN